MSVAAAAFFEGERHGAGSLIRALGLHRRAGRRGVQFCSDGAPLDAYRPIQMVHHGSKSERNAKIYSRRKDGLTLAAIGREFALSRETVRTVVKQMKLKAWWREIDEQMRRARFARLGVRAARHSGGPSRPPVRQR